MKNIIFTVFIMLIFSTAFSQVVQSVGIQTGVSLSNKKFDPEALPQPQYKPGVYTSITGDFISHERLAFTGQLGYCNKGYRDLTRSYDYKALFFNGLIKVKFNFNKIVSPYAIAGLRCDYKLNYLSKTTYAFGLSYGAGLTYKINRIYLSVEIQNQPDIIGISGGNTYSYKNNASILSFGVNYSFNK